MKNNNLTRNLLRDVIKLIADFENESGRQVESIDVERLDEKDFETKTSFKLNLK